MALKLTFGGAVVIVVAAGLIVASGNSDKTLKRPEPEPTAYYVRVVLNYAAQPVPRPRRTQVEVTINGDEMPIDVPNRNVRREFWVGTAGEWGPYPERPIVIARIRISDERMTTCTIIINKKIPKMKPEFSRGEGGAACHS